MRGCERSERLGSPQSEARAPLIRPSGTEPVLRVYAEAPDDGRVAALLKFGEAIAAES